MRSSSEPMSRRRFLAVVVGTGSALGVAGLGGWQLLLGRDSLRADSFAATGIVADQGVEIVEVAPGLVDATVWNDQLLTLRANEKGTGIILRSETSGTDYPVNAPDGFAARCVGVIDNTLIIGGHREVETGRMEFHTGTDYEMIAAAAGRLSGLLLSEPARPIVSGYTHLIVDTFPTLLTSEDPGRWDGHGMSQSHQGGSIGTVLESSGMIAVDRYLDAEIPDSVFEVAFVEPEAWLQGVEYSARAPIVVDHGALWGVSPRRQWRYRGDYRSCRYAWVRRPKQHRIRCKSRSFGLGHRIIRRPRARNS